MHKMKHFKILNAEINKTSVRARDNIMLTTISINLNCPHTKPNCKYRYNEPTLITMRFNNRQMFFFYGVKKGRSRTQKYTANMLLTVLVTDQLNTQIPVL
jgi:hypothetical protein